MIASPSGAPPVPGEGGHDAPVTPGPVETLDAPYLLALDTPVLLDRAGRYWAQASWARDLVAHMERLPRLTMVGVVLRGEPRSDMVPLPELGTRFVASRGGYGRARFYAGLPLLAWRLAREVTRARIVHSTIAHGEGFPYGWIALPLARLFGRTSVVTVEGASWRLMTGEKPGVARRIEAWLHEAVNRRVIRHVDYVAYQHEQFRRTLPSPRARGGVLYQASWIDEADVVGEARLDELIAERAARPVMRAIFATRMFAFKGTRVLIEAIERLARDGVEVDIDLIGTGDDRPLLDALAGTRLGRGQVRMLDEVPYGPAFFDLIAGYDLLLSPNLGDEQPRIIYDAAAQGVPAIATDAPGMLSCVEPGRTAIVIPRGDAAALADAIAALAGGRDRLPGMARAARAFALRHTHRRMHDERLAGIRAAFEQSR